MAEDTPSLPTPLSSDDRRERRTGLNPSTRRDEETTPVETDYGWYFVERLAEKRKLFDSALSSDFFFLGCLSFSARVDGQER